ncbi:hypothetical protein CBL_05533 [Carabus blaptoides fortunei]
MAAPFSKDTNLRVVTWQEVLLLKVLLEKTNCDIQYGLAYTTLVPQDINLLVANIQARLSSTLHSFSMKRTKPLVSHLDTIGHDEEGSSANWSLERAEYGAKETAAQSGQTPQPTKKLRCAPCVCLAALALCSRPVLLVLQAISSRLAATAIHLHCIANGASCYHCPNKRTHCSHTMEA